MTQEQRDRLTELLNRATGGKMNVDKAWFDEVYSNPFGVCIINGRHYPCETIEFEMI